MEDIKYIFITAQLNTVSKEVFQRYSESWKTILRLNQTIKQLFILTFDRAVSQEMHLCK